MTEESAPWRPLGGLLVEDGLITEAELEEALAVQGETGERLGEILVERGFVSSPELAIVLAKQLGAEVTREESFGSGLWAEIKRRHPRAQERAAGRSDEEIERQNTERVSNPAPHVEPAPRADRATSRLLRSVDGVLGEAERQPPGGRPAGRGSETEASPPVSDAEAPVAGPEERSSNAEAGRERPMQRVGPEERRQATGPNGGADLADELRNQIEELRARLAESRRDCDEAALAVAETSGELEVTRVEVEELRARLSAAEARLTEEKEAHAAALRWLDAGLEGFAEQAVDLAEREQQIAELNSRLAADETALEIERAAHACTKAELAQARGEADAARAALAETRRRRSAQ